MIRKQSDVDGDRWLEHFNEAAGLIQTRRWEQDLRYGDARQREFGYRTWLTLIVEELGGLAASLPDQGERATSRCLDRAIDVAAMACAIVEVAAHDVYRGIPAEAAGR